MGVFWIERPGHKPDGSNYALVFEAAAETIDDLVAVLGNKGIVGGAQLILVADGRGGKLVQSRRPTALTASGIARITLHAGGRVWEPEDAPATA